MNCVVKVDLPIKSVQVLVVPVALIVMVPSRLLRQMLIGKLV